MGHVTLTMPIWEQFVTCLMTKREVEGIGL